MRLTDKEKQHLKHRATGYGAEIYGGTAEERKTVLQAEFPDPTITIDARTISSQDEFIAEALSELGMDEEEIERLFIGPIDLRRALDEPESNVIILEFDDLEFETQKSIAQLMKGIAETIKSDTIMFGYTSSEKGSVVRAVPDLTGRVGSFGIDP